MHLSLEINCATNHPHQVSCAPGCNWKQSYFHSHRMAYSTHSRFTLPTPQNKMKVKKWYLCLCLLLYVCMSVYLHSVSPCSQVSSCKSWEYCSSCILTCQFGTSLSLKCTINISKYIFSKSIKCVSSSIQSSDMRITPPPCWYIGNINLEFNNTCKRQQIRMCVFMVWYDTIQKSSHNALVVHVFFHHFAKYHITEFTK